RQHQLSIDQRRQVSLLRRIPFHCPSSVLMSMNRISTVISAHLRLNHRRDQIHEVLLLYLISATNDRTTTLVHRMPMDSPWDHPMATTTTRRRQWTTLTTTECR